MDAKGPFKYDVIQVLGILDPPTHPTLQMSYFVIHGLTHPPTPVIFFVIFFVLRLTFRASPVSSEAVTPNKNTTMFTLYLRGLVRQMIVRQPQFLHSASHLGDVRVFSSRGPLHFQ